MAHVIPSRPAANVQTRSMAASAVGFDEGWTTLLLHLVVIVLTANSVVRVDQGQRSSVLIPLAVGGLLLGYAAARFPAIDALSHFGALVGGIVGTLALSAISTDGWSATWSTRGRNIYDLGYRLVDTQLARGNARLGDDDLIVVIGLTLWLVAYSSAWMLCRRHWLLPALIMPAVLVFINLRFEDQDSTVTLALLALAALIMTARHQAFVRQLEWARRRIPSPQGLPGRFTASGSVIALVTLLAGWTLPYEAPTGLVDSVSNQFVSRWEQVADKVNSLGNRSPAVQGESPIYTAFSDSFRIGGEFTPSQDPVASLEASGPSYLALRRYNIYNGTGWESDVNSTFRMEGENDDVTATTVTFSENQQVGISGDIRQERELNAGVITVLKEKGDLLFTIDTFVGATLPTLTILSWEQLPEQAIRVSDVPVESLPVDLRDLVKALRNAEYVPDPDNGRPVVRNSEQSFWIEQERARLLVYPVTTVLSYDTDGTVLLTVSGRLPNYDDIEAIYSNQRLNSQERYRVTGSASQADAEQLSSAGSDYPEWVTARYLQLPETLTPETVQLTLDIIAAADAKTSFDKAWVVQEYLHNTYAYALNSEQTPSGRDAVDFFLFGKQVGRCEDYATAMVVMLRSQGIPARLVAGYRASNELDSFGDFVYREEQAHTWVEVFFTGYGWVPFEPTQGQAPFDYNREPTAQPDLNTEDPSAAELSPTAEVVATAEVTPESTPIAAGVTADGNNPDSALTSGVGLAAILLVSLVTLVLACGFGLWAWSLRGLRPGAALYARTQRVGGMMGVQSDPTMTPAEYATALGRTLPKAGGPARYVANLYSAETYGGVEISTDVKHGGVQAWKIVRSSLFRWRPWRKRR